MSTWRPHSLCRFLKSFAGHVGKRLKVVQLRQHHLTKWLEEKPTWGDTAGNDAISIVQQMLNWAIEEGPRRLRYSESQKVTPPSARSPLHPSAVRSDYSSCSRSGCRLAELSLVDWLPAQKGPYDRSPLRS